MANLNVRIYNKFDSYENWMSSSLVLGAGEIAIASIPSGDNTGLTPPAIGIKVGDGSKTFAQLNWIQATAGDVYGWAKAATKPEYKADEITGLEDFIAGEIQDTNTEYSFSLVDNYKVKVQKKDVGGEYVDYQTLDLTAAFNAKADKVAGATAGNFAGLDADGNLTDSGKKAADFATAAQGAKADTAVQPAALDAYVTKEAAPGYGDILTKTDAAGLYAGKSATEAHINNGELHVTKAQKDAWDKAATDNAAAAKAAQDDVDALELVVNAIKDDANVDSFADVVAELAKKQDAGDYATKTEAQGYADAKDAAIQAAQKAADDAAAAVSTLDAYVGDFTPVAGETTVVGYVDAKIAAIPAQTDYSVTVAESTPEGYAKAYTFTQLGNTIATINIPKDMVVSSGSVVTDPAGQPAGTYIKLVLANAENSELFIPVDSLIEYVTGGTAADGMITVNVDENYVATATINDGTVTLAKMAQDVKDAIADAKKAGTDASAALGTAKTELEGKIADAQAAAEKKATDLNDAMNTRVEALEAIDHDHSNKDVLDGITSQKVAAWDAAQANVLENVAGVEGSIANKTFTVSGVSTDLLKQGSEELIFNCGSSAV